MSKKQNKKSVIKEFKEFISRGNVVDMAVGVIIGSAFTAIVNSLVKDIFTPLIGIIIGGINFASLSIKIPDTTLEDGTVIIQGAELTYGNFIQSIITFLLTALCVFIFVKAINAIRNGSLFKKIKDVTEGEQEPAPAPEPPKPSNEEVLLTEIRDLLKSQNMAAQKPKSFFNRNRNFNKGNNKDNNKVNNKDGNTDNKGSKENKENRDKEKQVDAGSETNINKTE